MSSSSDSDSDSDGEPNSCGARVFWGILKTPEKSSSNFINVPRTVVKPSRHRHADSPIIPSQEDSTPYNKTEKIVTKADDGVDLVRLPESLTTAGKGTMDVDLEANDVRLDTGRHSSNGTESPSLDVTSVQPFLTSPSALFPHACSESDVEGRAIQQSPFPMNHFEETQACDMQDGRTLANSKPLLISTPSNEPGHRSEDSRIPDLDPFNTAITTQVSSADPPMHMLSGPAVVTNSQTGTPCAAKHDFFSLPQRQECQSSPHPSLMSVPEVHPAVSTYTLSQTEPPLPENGNDIVTDPFLSGHSSTLLDQAPSSVAQSVDSVEVPLQTQQARSTQEVFGTTFTLEKTPDVQVRRLDLSHGPITQTQQYFLNEESKEKTDNGHGPVHPLVGTNNSNRDRSFGDDVVDRTIKKERRIKAKQEAECRRPCLMSLSPTSADVLNLLASPRKSLSPSRHSMALDNSASGSGSVDPLPQSKFPVTPQTGPSHPARRVPLTIPSPRRYDDIPLRLDLPHSVRLDDPNRTPARRVPLPAANSRARLLPLSLDNPNRKPAGRVPVVFPSPSKKASINSDTMTRVMEGSAAAPGTLSLENSTVKILPHDTAEQPVGSNQAPSTVIYHASNPLPSVSTQQSPCGEELTPNSDLPSLPMPSNPLLESHPPSDFRQPLSTPRRETAPAGISHLRLARMQSNFAKPRSRLPVLKAGFGPVTNGGQSRLSKSSAVTITRIPSPVKRSTPINLFETATRPPAVLNKGTGGSSGTSTYRRKRQRMMTEDADPDEPPTKRSMIFLRQLKKGIYNRQTSVGPSESREGRSPTSPSQSPGPPPISGMLEQPVPGQSSCQNLRNDTKDDTHICTGTLPSEPGPSTPSRDDSPLIDTDTASTTTTLSREPTFDEVLASSSSTLGPEASFTSLGEAGQEPRRTARVRKPSSIPANRRNPLPLGRTMAMTQQRASSSSKASKSSVRTVKAPGIPSNQRQLQALTHANTLRNQFYLADLQRQIIRKQGPRPASPTTKIRTIMERAKESSVKEREARAERRRRRGEGSNMSINSDGDSNDYMEVSSSPPRDVASSALRKHFRAPGDEEDYETPERAPKPSSLDPCKVSKNVKWDRGLARFTSDLPVERTDVQAHARATAEAIRKGCLVRDSKTLRLDPLGNVPDADIPLDDLDHGRVIVTRFVYDDDDDIEATRVKKKKS